MADLNELTAFAAVARLRSFRQAALERGVSASALSHALRALEERLGVRLLNRTTRSVTPTEAGQQLLARLVPAMREIDDALLDLSALQDVPAGKLRLNVPRPAARPSQPLFMSAGMAPAIPIRHDHARHRIRPIQEPACPPTAARSFLPCTKYRQPPLKMHRNTARRHQARAPFTKTMHDGITFRHNLGLHSPLPAAVFSQRFFP